MTLLTGDVEMFLWDGGCAFVGNSAARTGLHSHQAIQLVYGTDAEIRLSPAHDGPWASYRLALVASHQPHIMDATDVSLGVTMFIEPETLEGGRSVRSARRTASPRSTPHLPLLP